jgi:hypothetical protein
VHFHDFLSEDITGATIKHFKSLYRDLIFWKHVNRLEEPPAQIKAETKEAEGKLTEEQKKARYEEELTGWGWARSVIASRNGDSF